MTVYGGLITLEWPYGSARPERLHGQWCRVPISHPLHEAIYPLPRS